MKNKKYFFLLILFMAVFLSGCNQSVSPEPSLSLSGGKTSSQPEEKETVMMNKDNNQAPAMEIDTSKNYSAVLSTTEGEIALDLYADKTPLTVNNFIHLAKKGFYDKTIFHRVINGFMIQGGDPEGNGSGGPGYRFADEPFEGEYTRGTLAMANAGPNTNGSQFFIIHQDYALPKNYVIFGQVTQGIELVDKIATAAVKAGSSGEKSTPIEPVIVEKVEILEK